MARNWIIPPKGKEKGKTKIYSEAKSDQRVLFLFFSKNFEVLEDYSGWPRGR